MHKRFTKILNVLRSFCKTYSKKEMCVNVLQNLPRSWLPKVTTIQEAKDTTTLLLDDMMGSLLTHDISIENLMIEEEEKKPQNVELL